MEISKNKDLNQVYCIKQSCVVEILSVPQLHMKGDPAGAVTQMWILLQNRDLVNPFNLGDIMQLYQIIMELAIRPTCHRRNADVEMASASKDIKPMTRK
jgi:hypothetical protein